MSGVHGEVLGRLMRRGVEFAQGSYMQGAQTSYMQKLQADAELYENQGPEGEIRPEEMLPVLITAVLAFFIIGAIRYSIGEVVATLTVIETPTATAFIEDKPPAYADEPDAPLEKEPLMPSEAEADVEVLLIDNKPITTKISSTIKHITRIGGWRARFRGAWASIVYHAVHSISVNFVSAFVYRIPILGAAGPITNSFVYMLVSVLLARLHMSWTHSIISMPSSKPWYRRMVSRKDSKLVLLPSLAFAAAQQATILVPMLVLLIVDSLSYNTFHEPHKVCAKTVIMALSFLLIPLSAMIMAVCVLIPASAALTRVEAALLPEGEETIVPFDRSIVIGDVDVTARGSSKAVFRQAWRSFGCAARLRLIKVYAKMVGMQCFVFIVAAHLMLAEVYVIGGERLTVLVKSGAAQIKLAMIEAQENAAN